MPPTPPTPSPSSPPLALLIIGVLFLCVGLGLLITDMSVNNHYKYSNNWGSDYTMVIIAIVLLVIACAILAGAM